jgi:hypothetical protein
VGFGGGAEEGPGVGHWISSWRPDEVLC